MRKKFLIFYFVIEKRGIGTGMSVELKPAKLSPKLFILYN